MRTRYWMRTTLAAGCIAAAAAPAAAQTIDFLNANAGGGPVVRNAPYSGEGVTTVRQILYDGTRIERTVTATMHRDSAGRVRREQSIFGLAALDAPQDSAQVVTIVDPVNNVIWSLTTADKTARRMRARMNTAGRPGAGLMPPPPPPPPPPGVGAARPGAPPIPPPPPAPFKPRVESLGTKAIEGLAATGTKSTLTFPAGAQGNDRPIEVTEERWESTELRVLLYSRRHDPRTGDIEYRLTKVTRDEPAADLFAVPSDYRVVDPPSPPPPPPPPPPVE
jgi:hypothetical protein